MAIEVRVTATLQRLVGGQKAVRAQGATVGELLDYLDAQYPSFREQISGDNGEIHRFINIYLNDEDIRFLQNLDTPVKEGDTISILPALAGGAGPVRSWHGSPLMVRQAHHERANPLTLSLSKGERHTASRKMKWPWPGAPEPSSR
ncbi:MAG TPA: ubiquitin-like small modifier protein 1 [Dehalococcoidia bacterium]|nr:ubiquitin-like small modifier protein 1 [Dehalococcoidia bacterium]